MAVPNIQVPPGTQKVVNLLLTDPLVGDPSFQPGSIGEASSSSFSSGLPVYPVVVEGPGSNGSVSRTEWGVNDSSNQIISAAGSGNGLGLGMVLNVPYPYDPAQLAFGNRQLTRGTGGLLNFDNPLYDEGAATDDDGTRAGQDVRAFLYAVDDATPTQAVRMRATAAGALLTSTSQTAPGTITTAADFQTLAATVSTLIAANLSRSQAIIQNLDAVDSIRVGDASIGAAQGILVAAGESITLAGTYAISVFPVAGTPLVSRTEIEA